MSRNLILDNMENPYITKQSQKWYFVSDQIMGGVSSGKFQLEEIDSMLCYRMVGKVSTENNGGFIQMKTKLKPEIETYNHQGIYIKVYGNNKDYRIHLRTNLTFAPWQYYRYKFYSPDNWIEIKATFSEFEKSNFYQPKTILRQKIRSIGLVAGFNNFKSDICLGEIGFF